MVSYRILPGRPRNVWLNKIQEDANTLLLSMLWRSEIARGHMDRRNGHLDYAMTMMMKDVRLASKMEGETNFSRHLQAVQNRDC